MKSDVNNEMLKTLFVINIKYPLILVYLLITSKRG